MEPGCEIWYGFLLTAAFFFNLEWTTGVGSIDWLIDATLGL